MPLWESESAPDVLRDCPCRKQGLSLTAGSGAAETDEKAYETKAKGRRDDAEGLTGRWQGSRTGEALVTHGKVSIQRQQSQVSILKSPCSIQCESLFPFQKSGITKTPAEGLLWNPIALL